MSSCSHIYHADNYYFNSINDDKKEFKVSDFKVSDFKVYAFNICEKYKKGTLPIKRFCECPDNFFEISKKEEIKKNEETYLLINKKLNLVLYLTTFSHKYIYENQSGFLNDSCIYKNKMYVKDFECIYIGKLDSKNEIITFIKKETTENMIWHFKKDSLLSSYTIDKVKIATAENKFKPVEFISLDTVLSNEIIFKEVKYDFFYSKEKRGLLIDKFYLIDTELGIEIIVESKEACNERYRFSSKKIPYQMKFEDIEN